MIRSPLTLLERLAHATDSTAVQALSSAQIFRSTTGDALRLHHSILANLRRVLGTRIGHAPAQLDLGTPAPSDVVRDYPACIPRLQRAIGVCVQKYEPRLAAVRVQHVPGEAGDVTIRFQIAAVLANPARTPIIFAMQVDNQGHLELRT